MKEKINRRNFLKTVAAAGACSALPTAKTKAEPNTPQVQSKKQKPQFPQVLKQKLGKTGVEVPCIALGTNRLDNQAILRAALQWGITYWDTANSYVGGNSELEIGKFLTKKPEIRKDLFIASKASGAKTIADIDERLKTSFERMNTTYIDLYYGVHGLSEPEQLTEELKQWVKEAKKQKLIRFFGFTCHKNMGRNLAAAAKHDWIDAVMVSYNFRLMQDEEIQAGIEACHNAGIAVIAMKTLGRRTDHNIETEEDKKLVGPFLQQGLTEDQAKIKVVLQDKRITTACVGMNNIAHLTINAAAAIDKTKLSKADIEALSEYARATCSGYCVGCAYICDAAAPETPYISEIMRYLMYYNSYGQHQYARELFAAIPPHIRAKLLTTDYSTAQARCPQHLPIAKLVTEAVKKFA